MKTKLLAALTLIAALTASAQVDETTPQGMDRLACTSIMVGKNASTDGSVITSHTCDSWYRTWMTMTPARDYERDTVTAIYSERMHTQSPLDSTKMHVRGVIPQVRHTYRYLDTAYPCLNEKQLAMGETTIGGRDTLRNKKGLFTRDRKPKLAAHYFKSRWNAIPDFGYKE